MNAFAKLVLIFLLAFWSCERNTAPSSPTADLPVVSYGTSFGECMGYCNRQVVIQDGVAVFTKSSWLPEDPDIQLAEELTAAEWSSVLQLIDWQGFEKQPDRIGCPDCADGGAEWIEIEYEQDAVKRVTFEYGASLKGHEALLEQLREIFQRMDAKME